MQPIHILKPGRFAGLRGGRHAFGPAELAAAAAAYDPDVCEAPIVVGHPKVADPAYGWIERLELAGDKLCAVPRQVPVEFAAAVEAGHWKKVSASFWPPDHPANPRPGAYYLRHVGFLGATPPAIKGLDAIEFASDDAGALTIEFSDWSDSVVARLLRGLRDWMIGTHGQDTADRVLPTWDLDALAEQALREQAPAEPVPAPLAFADPPTPEESMPTAAELAAREAALAEREAALAARETSLAELAAAAAAAAEHERRRTAAAEFCDAQIGAGRLLPRARAGLVEVLAALPDDQVIEFADGDGSRQLATGAWLREFVAGLPKVVEFGELAAGDQPGIDLCDADAVAVAAQAYQAEQKALGNNISTARAVAYIHGER